MTEKSQKSHSNSTTKEDIRKTTHVQNSHLINNNLKVLRSHLQP